MKTYEDEKKIVSIGVAKTHITSRTLLNRPRLNVKCSFEYIYARIIDDKKSVTFYVKVTYKDFEAAADYNKDAKKVGAAIAKVALAAGINKVYLTDNHNLSQAALKLLSAAREGGLKF